MTEARALQKAESEELEVQKPQVKLRRTVSEVARPASTPPIMASAIKDEDDEDRIIAELEVGQGHPWPLSHQLGPAPFPCQADPTAVSWTRTGGCTLGLPAERWPGQDPVLWLRSFLHCKMGKGSKVPPGRFEFFHCSL